MTLVACQDHQKIFKDYGVFRDVLDGLLVCLGAVEKKLELDRRLILYTHAPSINNSIAVVLLSETGSLFYEQVE